MFIMCSAKIGSTALTTLQDQSWSDGIQSIMLGASANHQAEFVALIRQLSTMAVSTRKIDALTTYSLGDASIYFAQVDNGGVANGTYISLTGATGYCMIVPQSISWSFGGVAVLSYAVQFLSANGTTAPITVGTVAGATTAETDVWIGSNEKTSSIQVNFGIGVTVPGDGKLYPTECFVVTEHPQIRLVTRDTTLITTAQLNPGSISSLSATFAKIANGGVRGAVRTYTGSGHLRVGGVRGGKPGEVEVICDVTGGLTIS